MFEEHDRSLVALVQNYALDILFVRTNDIIEFVGDGVADLGHHRRATSSARPAPSCRASATLGYGRCRLAAAVPNDTPYQAVEDLAGLRVATAHPNTARRFFAERGIPVEIIPISGAVEVAPRLGLAEGDRRPRVDRLDARDERPAPDRRRPRRRRRSSSPTRPPTASARAELAAIDTMLSAVIAARGRKYLMMNAPAAKLAELERLLPALESPDGHPARPRRA